MIYQLVKPILFRRDPETVHDAVLSRLEGLQESAMGRTILRMMSGTAHVSPMAMMGLDYAHPVGIAAGFDKNARAVIALQELGFSHVEIGTVTPRPQPGNPQPRIWRFPESRALVNALGFPGEGMRSVRAHLEKARKSGVLRIPVGINIGKNFDTPLEDAGLDYLAVYEHLYELGDYFVVNVSSPNTKGLRELQTVRQLRSLLTPLVEFNLRSKSRPLLLKIAPDLSDEELVEIAGLVKEMNLAGMIAGNTTIRRELVPNAAELDRGGLSGAPLYARTLEMTRLLRAHLPASSVLIAVGGIERNEQVKELLAAGANLVQVYTAFIYHGPGVVRMLTR